MIRISMLIPDAELAEIDAVATPNRTAFMLAATREAVSKKKRQQLDDEIARCLEESASEDRALADEFCATAADGL